MKYYEIWKNTIKWKKKQKLKDLIKFSEDFNIFIKQCYCIAWSVKKMQKVKIQNLQRNNPGRIMLLSQ